jgi:drug/metabolite transporter (DMT)-like permease
MLLRIKIAFGFLAVYLLWGSTYLAVRLAIETVPPFLMMAVRCLAAGVLLSLLAWAGGARWPRAAEWRGAALVGLLFFVGCHGVMAWAQRSVPTGFAALMLATVPLWVPLIELAHGERPSGRMIAALAVGFVSVGWLIGAGHDVALDRLPAPAVIALLAAALSWALGSVVSRVVALPTSVTLAAGLELLSGGVALLIGSALGGGFADFDPAAVSARSAGGLAWLILVGSVLTFTVYGWLLRMVRPERVATYAYVNPVVALALGWLVLGEPAGAHELAASALILAAVGVALAERPRAARSVGSLLARS